MERRSGGSPADYNQNGVVDAADYVVWHEQDGTSGTGLAADGDGNGMVDGADYEFWQAHSATGPLLPAAVHRVPLQCQNPPPL